MFDELTEFCFVFWFGFRASLLDFTSRIQRLHVCYYCADVWSVLAYFCSDTVTHVHRQADQVRSSTACVCRSFHDARGWSSVRAQPWLLQRLLGLAFVARCALVRNSLQTSCPQWVMTRYHTLDTLLEIWAWYGTVCHTDTFLVGSLPHCHSILRSTTAESCMSHGQYGTHRNAWKCVITQSVIFNSQCTRNRVWRALPRLKARNHWASSQRSAAPQTP